MKYEALDIWDEILTTHEVFCSKCRKPDMINNCDEHEACDYFFNRGWRKTKDNIYCPECALKRLNQKKN